MPFWYAVFLGLMWSIGMLFVEITWASILKLNISFSFFLISIPIVCVAVTAFCLLASDKAFFVGFGVGAALVFLSIFSRIIIELIKKSKQ